MNREQIKADAALMRTTEAAPLTHKAGFAKDKSFAQREHREWQDARLRLIALAERVVGAPIAALRGNSLCAPGLELMNAQEFIAWNKPIREMDGTDVVVIQLDEGE
jgi:hypothetical protein